MKKLTKKQLKDIKNYIEDQEIKLYHTIMLYLNEEYHLNDMEVAKIISDLAQEDFYKDVLK